MFVFNSNGEYCYVAPSTVQTYGTKFDLIAILLDNWLEKGSCYLRKEATAVSIALPFVTMDFLSI